MNVTRLNLKQCKEIIDNDFLGKHDRRGRQKDYSDYRDEIMKHYWELSKRQIIEKQNYIEIENTFIDETLGLDTFLHSKIFNRFKYISLCIDINQDN